MNILLINPPADNLVKTFAPDALTEEMGFYPPMGLLYLASSVKKAHGDRFDPQFFNFFTDFLELSEGYFFFDGSIGKNSFRKNRRFV